jgi:hypothetical protein
MRIEEVSFEQIIPSNEKLSGNFLIQLLEKLDSSRIPPAVAVEYSEGTFVIGDIHHRNWAHYALGGRTTKIKVLENDGEFQKYPLSVFGWYVGIRDFLNCFETFLLKEFPNRQNRIWDYRLDNGRIEASDKTKRTLGRKAKDLSIEFL